MEKVILTILRVGEEAYYKREEVIKLLERLAIENPYLTIGQLLQILDKAGV